MKTFMGKNFLLTTETAKILYHTYAEILPIIDYHCHVPPKDIAEDKQYANLTELWLGGEPSAVPASTRNTSPETHPITRNSARMRPLCPPSSATPFIIGRIWS